MRKEVEACLSCCDRHSLHCNFLASHFSLCHRYLTYVLPSLSTYVNTTSTSTPEITSPFFLWRFRHDHDQIKYDMNVIASTTMPLFHAL